MITKESAPIQEEAMLSEPSDGGGLDTQNQGVPEETGQQESKSTTIIMEVVDMRIELVQRRKQERRMERTLRWPLHSNTPRITF